jgi:hypothetical protein
MLNVRRITNGIHALRIGRIAVVLLMATSSSGCATLMQPFSAVQPTAALVEPDQDTSANVSDEVSADFATTPVDNQWITHVYRGDADPIAGVAKM